ncbi:MAG: hypothetical protein ACRBDL_06635 [Alphaproteobacteria bacterium]
MNIELFVSGKGQVVLTCHGRFTKVIEEVTLNKMTGVLTFVFLPDMDEWEVNCTVSEELCEKVKNQLFCAIGYFENTKLVASEYVRFSCR